MKTKLIVTAVLASTLAACSSVPDNVYERRAHIERERQIEAVNIALDNAPKWMTELPKSDAAIYSAGTAKSGDMSFADEKATTVALGKVCSSAGGTVDKSSKIFRADIGDSSVENSTTAIRAICSKVDVTGVEVVDVKRVAEGSQFRSYVLIALPLGEANILQKRKDDIYARELATRQAEAEFSAMDKR